MIVVARTLPRPGQERGAVDVRVKPRMDEEEAARLVMRGLTAHRGQEPLGQGLGHRPERRGRGQPPFGVDLAQHRLAAVDEPHPGVRPGLAGRLELRQGIHQHQLVVARQRQDAVGEVTRPPSEAHGAQALGAAVDQVAQEHEVAATAPGGQRREMAQHPLERLGATMDVADDEHRTPWRRRSVPVPGRGQHHRTRTLPHGRSGPSSGDRIIPRRSPVELLTLHPMAAPRRATASLCPVGCRTHYS